jgi:hypothetical protein
MTDTAIAGASVSSVIKSMHVGSEERLHFV